MQQLITFTIALPFSSHSQLQELNVSPNYLWRYLNHSILNYDPHPSGEFLSFHFAFTSLCQSIWSINRTNLYSCIALLKMGDHYYDSRKQEDSFSLVGQAILMYSRAALAGSPQVTDLLEMKSHHPLINLIKLAQTQAHCNKNNKQHYGVLLFPSE